jgi:hypothetical protein
MAIHTLSYLSISPDQRKASADVARQRLRDRMSDPLLTSEQLERLYAELMKLDQWEAGQAE